MKKALILIKTIRNYDYQENNNQKILNLNTMGSVNISVYQYILSILQYILIYLRYPDIPIPKKALAVYYSEKLIEILKKIRNEVIE